MEEAAVLENTAVFIYNKVFSYIFKRRKIWNPQSEFTSDEENSTFQGIFMPMERTVYTYSNLVKILILTKGVDFFDTLHAVVSHGKSHSA